MSSSKVSSDVRYLHMASQYLSAAGKSFLEEKKDDSHTNMRWDTSEDTLWTDPLNEEGLKLGLNVAAFALDLFHPLSGLVASYPLKGARHLDIVNWIERERSFCGLDQSFEFDLHYDLPYDTRFKDSLQFEGIAGDDRMKHAELRTQADQVLHGLEKALSSFDHGDVRIWPHHFDTGLLMHSKQFDGLQLSLGLAMPDEISETWYYYLRSFYNDEPVPVDGLKSLAQGRWIADDFNGAVLSADESDVDRATTFFVEAAEAISSSSLLGNE